MTTPCWKTDSEPSVTAAGGDTDDPAEVRSPYAAQPDERDVHDGGERHGEHDLDPRDPPVRRIRRVERDETGESGQPGDRPEHGRDLAAQPGPPPHGDRHGHGERGRSEQPRPERRPARSGRTCRRS